MGNGDEPEKPVKKKDLEYLTERIADLKWAINLYAGSIGLIFATISIIAALNLHNEKNDMKDKFYVEKSDIRQQLAKERQDSKELTASLKREIEVTKSENKDLQKAQQLQLSEMTRHNQYTLANLKSDLVSDINDRIGKSNKIARVNLHTLDRKPLDGCILPVMKRSEGNVIYFLLENTGNGMLKNGIIKLYSNAIATNVAEGTDEPVFKHFQFSYTLPSDIPPTLITRQGVIITLAEKSQKGVYPTCIKIYDTNGLLSTTNFWLKVD